MTYERSSRFEANASATASAPIRATGRRPLRPRRLVAAGLLALTFGIVTAATVHQVRSQGVQLVKVDVQVVAHGARVSKLTGHTVANEKNERVGKIDDFIIGHDEGHSLFTILQVGGFLGLGSRLVAVPYDSLVIDLNNNKVELPGASKDQLEALAEFRYGS